MRESEQPIQRICGCWPLARVGKRVGFSEEVFCAQVLFWVRAREKVSRSGMGGRMSVENYVFEEEGKEQVLQRVALRGDWQPALRLGKPIDGPRRSALPLDAATTTDEF